MLLRSLTVPSVDGVDAAPAAYPVRDDQLLIERLEPRVLFTQFVSAVDNPFFPLNPGTQFTYRGTAEDGGAMLIEISVLERKKLIAGVRCTVKQVHEYVNGVLTEKTFDWYAQDRAGNVWYFGEDSTEIEDDVIISRSGSWQAGLDGAEPGMIMAARPKSGDQYRQESLPGVAEDQARVVTTQGRLRTRLGVFRDVVMTVETTPLDPEVLEYKYYARGLGLIRAVGVQGELESVDLTEIDQPIVSHRHSSAGLSSLSSMTATIRVGPNLLAGRTLATELFAVGAIGGDEPIDRDVFALSAAL